MLAIIMAIEDEEDRLFVERIFNKYSKNMYLIAANILNNHDDAEDCVQDILAGGLNPKVRSAAYNTIKTYFKALGRFIVNEARDGLLSSSFNSFSTEIYKAVVGSYIN